MTKKLPKCRHEVCDGLEGYLKHDMWKWCEVDLWFDLIVFFSMKGTITFEISAIGLIWDSYLSGNAYIERDIHTLNMYLISIL